MHAASGQPSFGAGQLDGCVSIRNAAQGRRHSNPPLSLRSADGPDEDLPNPPGTSRMVGAQVLGE